MHRRVLIALPLLIGCGKLDPGNRIASTLADTEGSTRRLWAITRSAFLYSVVLEGDGSSRWVDEGSTVLSQGGGVSAISWVEPGLRHERAYYVSSTNELVTRRRDGAATGWINTPAPGGATLLGPTAAVSLMTSARIVLATADLSGAGRVARFTGSGSPETSYSGTLVTPPSALAADTPIAGASSQVSACFVMRTSAGALAAYDTSGWRVSAPPSGTLAGAVAIVGEPAAPPSIGGSYTAYARGSSGEVWRVAIGGCLGTPSWTSLGSPPGGVAPGPYALDAALTPGELTDSITVAAASNDGLLYVRQMTFRLLGPWTARPAAGDTLGALGSVHAATSSGRVLYVGDVSQGSSTERAGYAFESPAAGAAARDFLDPNAPSTLVNDATEGAWTESSASERRGKVIVAASVIDASSADIFRKSWVHVATSEDDGHSFGDPRPLERCYPSPGLPAPACAEVINSGFPSGSTTISGDPWTAVDTNGTRFASFHEIAVDACGTAGPFIFSSRVSVYRVDASSMIRETGSTYVSDAISGSAAEPYYVDHPSIATTADGRTHLFFWKKVYNVDPSTGRTTLMYRSRTSGGTWSPVTTLFTEESYGRSSLGPNAVVAGDSTVLAAWLDRRPAGGTQIRTCRLSGASCATLVGTATTGASCMDGDDPSFGTTQVRATPFAIAGHPLDANRFYLAYQRAESASSPCPGSGTGPKSIVLTQTTDAGLTWTAPVTVTPAGMDTMDVALAVQGDGSVFVSYLQRANTTSSAVDPFVAVCAACSTTPASSDFVIAPAPGAATVNLAALPEKCGGDGDSVFMGDYHHTTGGLSRVHLLRVHAGVGDPAPTGRLRFSTISRWVRR